MDELRQRYNPEGSLLRRHQLRMLEILKEIDRICQKAQDRLLALFRNIAGERFATVVSFPGTTIWISKWRGKIT